MAYTSKQWDTVRAFYECGLTLAEIVDREEVEIVSKSQISKKAKSDGWIKSEEKKQLISREVKTKQEVSAIRNEKETLKETDRIIHETLVDERTRHIKFFTSAAMTNTENAMLLPCESHQDHERLSNTILRSKETALGKQPDTAIQINNSAPPQIIIEGA